jgi:hypothetical protein
MKRLNPNTNNFFTRGESREDGYLFWEYLSQIGKNGFFYERWYNPTLFKERIEKTIQVKKNWDLKNKNHIQFYRQEYRKNNQILITQRQKDWNNKNFDYYVQWRKNNPLKILEASAKYKKNNKIKIKAWELANPEKLTAKLAKRRASKLQRTMNWDNDSNKIKEFYFAADFLGMITGEWHEVDHIIPLQGKNVSGLHVVNNLQVITRKENRSKYNNF